MMLFGITDPQVQLRTANRSTMAIAMIETKTAFAALDGILAVDGLDGVFVGPSDLSVTLSGGDRIAPLDSFIEATIRDIAKRAKAAGKVAGAYAINGERARFYRGIGYRLIALGSDQVYLSRGINAMLDEAGGPG